MNPNQPNNLNQPASSPATNPISQSEQTFTIHQASELLGVKTKTLRHYCNLGLIPKLKRNHNGYRIFSEDQINQLHNIAYLHRCGFTAREIKTYLRSTPAIQKQILGTKKQQLWQKLDDIRQNIDFIERQEDLLNQS